MVKAAALSFHGKKCILKNNALKNSFKNYKKRNSAWNLFLKNFRGEKCYNTLIAFVVPTFLIDIIFVLWDKLEKRCTLTLSYRVDPRDQFFVVSV